MTDERHPLAEHLRPALDEARIERQWSAIEAAGLPSAVPARSWRAWTVALSLAVAAGAAAGALLYPRSAPQLAPIVEGAWLHSAEQPVSVRLEDGSRVELSPASQLKLVENRQARVTLELRSGKARFEVKHDRARPFAIAAGPAEVRVIGTRFELSRTTRAGSSTLRVQVSEGVVEVRRRDRPGEPAQRIHGGESWSAELSETTTTAAPRADAPTEAPDALPTDAVPADAEDSAEPEAEAEPPPSAEPSRRTQPRVQARADAPVDDASTLFSRASLARRAGRMRDAADGYAELLSRFPSDARAGLSAFELGRIRMDALGDADGAIRALEEALRTGGTASFHEDALARIVIASDALGRRQACRDARARYLARHPNGVHAQVLSARCP
jgi:TolA-binding protein